MNPFTFAQWTGRSAGPAPDSDFETTAPIGVVDIGSNSVRLVVYTGAKRAPTALFNEKELCGLGRNVGTTAMLGEPAIERAVAVLRRFRAIAQLLEVQHLVAVATAAVRDARDGALFIERAEEALGARIEVLSGEREARLAAQGILMGFMEPDGIAGDLGGGSLELISIRGGELEAAASLALGVLRLTDDSLGKHSKAAELAHERFASVDWANGTKPKTFYAVGGTWRAFARWHMEQTDYPLRVMHHYEIATDQAIEAAEKLRKIRKPLQASILDSVPRARRETLPIGALVLEKALKAIQPERVVTSVFGIREGLLYDLLTERQRASDPLITFCDGYARARSRSAEHGHELFDWMNPIIAAAYPQETAEQKRLRLAACLLSDIGWRAHPDYRGEQSLNVVAHAALTGLNHRERVFLALTLYFRHEGATDGTGAGLSGRLKVMAGPDELQRARVVAAAIRAAHMVSCGISGVIPETPVVCADGRMTLHMPKARAHLDGGRMRRRFQSLSQLIGHEFDVKFVQT
ncbi:MAG: exopolyphosphatase [Hyphomicrobiaceae bacterium]